MVNLIFNLVNAVPADYDNVITLNLTTEQPGVNAAPAAVWFEAAVTSGSEASGPDVNEVYDPLYHEILYQWDFGDAGQAVPKTALNMPETWKNSNRGYGRRVAHVFNEHGEKTVTCYAYEPKTRRFGSSTVTVNVGDPAEVFANEKTIIIDPALADYSDTHPGATVVADWGASRAPRNAVGLGVARIMLAPGYFATLTDANSSWTTNQWGNVRLEALDPEGAACGFIAHGKHFGGKNNTIIKDEGADCVENVYIGLRMIGEWDPTSERGRLWDPFYTDKDNDYNLAHHLIMHHRCSYSGFEAIRSYNVSTKTGLAHYAMFSDTHITDWQDYGLFLKEDLPGSVAIVGCAIAQNPDALSGGAKNNMYNGHGPVRSANNSHVYISVCDLFTRHGWSNGTTWAPVGGTRTANQPCIRMNTNGDPDRSSYVDRCTLEGAVWYQEQDKSGGSDRPGNHILDKIMQVLGPDDYLFEGNILYHGGTTVRNMLSIKLDTPAPGSQNMMTFLSAGAGNGGVANSVEGFRAYNNTFVDLRTVANGVDAFNVPINVGFDVQVIENNVFHQPFASTASDAGVDVNTPLPGFNTRHKGPRYGFLHHQGMFQTDVAPGASFEVPYSEITDALYNTTENVGAATDQAYWAGIAGTDTNHWIHIGSIDTGTRHFADEGALTVTPTATGLSVTNNTLDVWSSGLTWRFKPARDSMLPPFDPQLSSVGMTVPVALPLSGSEALDDGDIGTYAYDDFYEVKRPASGRESGAIQV